MPIIANKVQPELPPNTALCVELLPASIGDCILLRAPLSSGREYRLLIDTGPDAASYDALSSRLRSIPTVDGCRSIDLFVITHIDYDHIGNAERLLRDSSLALQFGDIWFNGLRELPANRSIAQADSVSRALVELELPHNLAFGGGAVTVGTSTYQVVNSPTELPRFTLLGPRLSALGNLRKEWPDVASRFKRGRPDAASGDAMRGVGPRLDRPPIDLEALAGHPLKSDSSRPNRSSIVLLVEHQGASILLAGDGHPMHYGPALAAVLSSRPLEGQHIDAIKLAHHGSRANTEKRLHLFGASHYLVSSNNASYGLPDDETLARLVVHQLTRPTLWFNYATPLNLRWEQVAVDSKYGFDTEYPTAADKGVILQLPAQPA